MKKPSFPRLNKQAELSNSVSTAATGSCPRCATQLTNRADWCLKCGFAVSTKVAKTPRWRTILTLAALLPLLLLGSAGALLINASNSPVQGRSPGITAPGQLATTLSSQLTTEAAPAATVTTQIVPTTPTTSATTTGTTSTQAAPTTTEPKSATSGGASVGGSK